jgi:hypothetical protein
MQNLRRLSFQCHPDYWYAREVRLGLSGAGSASQWLHKDVAAYRRTWYTEMIRRFESIPRLRVVAIFVSYPSYYKAERDAGDQAVRISKEGIWGVPRGAWPISIRD